MFQPFKQTEAEADVPKTERMCSIRPSRPGPECLVRESWESVPPKGVPVLRMWNVAEESSKQAEILSSDEIVTLDQSMAAGNEQGAFS